MEKVHDLENLQNSEVIVEDAVWNDSKKNLVLFEESGYQKWKCLTLYNMKYRRTEFGKQLTEGDFLYVASPDGRYVVGHKCQMVGDEDPTKDGKTQLNFYNFTKKKMWVLFLMKHVKVSNKSVNLIQFYESPFIAQHVSEMVGK